MNRLVSERLVHLFEWPSRHHVHVLFPLMVILAIGVHAAAFLLFQVYYTPGPGKRPRPAEVYVLPAEGPAAAGLKAWLEAADPALMTHTQALHGKEAVLAPVEYHPRFENPSFQLDVPATPSARTTLPLPSELMVGMGLTEKIERKPLVYPRLPTTLDLTGGLVGRKVEQLAPIRISSAPATLPEPAILRAGLSPDGRVRHAFLVQSSGSSELDEAAIRSALQSRFSSGPPEVTWGEIIFLWGADLYEGKEATP